MTAGGGLRAVLFGLLACLAMVGGGVPAADAALPDCAATPQPGNTKIWVGSAGGGNWQQANNWQPAGAPSATDHVCITGNGSGTLSVPNNTSVASLRTTGMGLTFNASGALTIAAGTDASSVDGTVTMTGGTLSTGAPLTLGGLVMSGNATLDGGGTVTLDGSGPFSWSGGVWQGAGRVVVADGRTLTLGGSSLSVNRPIENHGTVNWQSGSLFFGVQGSGSGIINGSAADPGALVIGGDLSASLNGNPSAFISNSAGSTITKTAGAAAAIIQVGLTNDGTVQVQSGTLQLLGSATSSGTYQIGGNTLDVRGGTQVFNGPIQGSGTGTVSFTGASATINGTYQVPRTTITANTATFSGAVTLPALTQSAGTLDGAGTVTLDGSGPFSWSGGVWQGAGRVVVADGRTLTLGGSSLSVNRPIENHGTVDWQSPSLFFGATAGSGGGIINGSAADPGALIVGGNLSASLNGNPTAAITNSAGSTITKTTGTGTALFQPAVTNAGVIQVQSGTLSLPTLTNLSGTTLTGGTFRVAGTLKLVTSANVVTNAATISLEAPGAGVIDGATVPANALRNLASTTAAGALSLTGGATLTTLTAYANAGTLSVGAGSTLTTNGSVTNTGLVEGSGSLTTSGAGAKLANSGIVRPGIGTGTPGRLTINGGLDQQPAGTLQIDVGGTSPGVDQDQLAVSGPTTLAGTLAISTLPGFAPVTPTAHTIVTGAPVSGTFSPVNGRVGTLGGRYAVNYLPGAVVLNFSPPSLTLSLPASLSLGSIPVGTSGSVALTASVDSSYRSGYSLAVERTAFDGVDFPLSMTFGGAPSGAELFGSTAGTAFQIPVTPAAPRTFGRRVGGPAPNEAGLTTEGGPDQWTATLAAGPVVWTRAGTHSSTVTITAVTLP